VLHEVKPFTKSCRLEHRHHRFNGVLQFARRGQKLRSSSGETQGVTISVVAWVGREQFVDPREALRRHRLGCARTRVGWASPRCPGLVTPEPGDRGPRHHVRRDTLDGTRRGTFRDRPRPTGRRRARRSVACSRQDRRRTGADGARLEGSKAYLKEFLASANVPSAATALR